jgi:hypothetical protein
MAIFLLLSTPFPQVIQLCPVHHYVIDRSEAIIIATISQEFPSDLASSHPMAYAHWDMFSPNQTTVKEVLILTRSIKIAARRTDPFLSSLIYFTYTMPISISFYASASIAITVKHQPEGATTWVVIF